MVVLWVLIVINVDFLLYSENKMLDQCIEMLCDDVLGVWCYEGDMLLDRQFYCYEVIVYYFIIEIIEILLVIDLYLVLLSINGCFLCFVNLVDEDLKFDGWDIYDIFMVDYFEDVVIYEGYVCDFSVCDMLMLLENCGKYLVFIEQGIVLVEYFKKLVEVGLIYFYVLFVNDIVIVDEDFVNMIDLYDIVGDLCCLNSEVVVCEEESEDVLIIDVYNVYDLLF